MDALESRYSQLLVEQNKLQRELENAKELERHLEESEQGRSTMKSFCGKLEETLQGGNWQLVKIQQNSYFTMIKVNQS